MRVICLDQSYHMVDNRKHIWILEQGVDVWNKWRKENEKVRPNLRGADLQRMNLRGANLRKADLRGVNISHVDFQPSDLLNKTELSQAWMNSTSITPGDFWEDSMKIAMGTTDLREANLENADLSCANLREAILTETDLTHSKLNDTDFEEATFGYTKLYDLDLSTARLAYLKFRGPCFIDILTLKKTGSKSVPLEKQREIEALLRGCGLSDWEIEATKLQRPELSNEQITDVIYRIHDLRAQKAVMINPLFISYSHNDSDFVNKLETYLNEKGIRFWRDVHQATAGRLEKQVDKAMRLNPTVLLILSDYSVKSDWVQHEARVARKLEIELGRDILCPIALDDSWKKCRWPQLCVSR